MVSIVAYTRKQISRGNRSRRVGLPTLELRYRSRTPSASHEANQSAIQRYRQHPSQEKEENVAAVQQTKRSTEPRCADKFTPGASASLTSFSSFFLCLNRDRQTLINLVQSRQIKIACPLVSLPAENLARCKIATLLRRLLYPVTPTRTRHNIGLI
jgi:hypothetical protein